MKELIYIMTFGWMIQEVEFSDGWMRHVYIGRDCHALHIALDGAVQYSYTDDGQVLEGKGRGMCGSLELAKS